MAQPDLVTLSAWDDDGKHHEIAIVETDDGRFAAYMGKPDPEIVRDTLIATVRAASALPGVDTYYLRATAETRARLSAEAAIARDPGLAIARD